MKKNLLIYSVGLGGDAEKGLLTELLTKEFKVWAIGPRNSGVSMGHLTIDNYVSDLDRKSVV